MKIGIDVDSGERPFHELVEGVLQSSEIYDDSVFFIIGNASRIRSYFPAICDINNIVLVDAKQIVEMSESPILGIKRKKNSTIVTGVNLIKNGTIDVLFSPGNTGATVAASVLGLGLFHGLKKPAMGSFFPRAAEGETLILDVGANPESREDYMYHNAILGSAFYKTVYHTEKPTVGLLSVGTEFGKGNSIIKKAYSQLLGVDGFIGNVEPYNLIDGSVDVVVCDGFTGNTVIKIAESLKKLFAFRFKEHINGLASASFTKKILFGSLKKILDDDRKRADFTDGFLPQYYGGAPLLGVNGTVLVGHGQCGKKDLMNAIEFAHLLHREQIYSEIMQEWKKNK